MLIMANNATIGGRSVLLNARWLLPENESIDFKIEDEDGDVTPMKIQIKSSSDGDGAKPILDVKEIDGIPVITFINWNGKLGVNTNKPIKFAESENGDVELTFLAVIAKLGDIYRVEFQVMSERKK